MWPIGCCIKDAVLWDSLQVEFISCTVLIHSSFYFFSRHCYTFIVLGSSWYQCILSLLFIYDEKPPPALLTIGLYNGVINPLPDPHWLHCKLSICLPYSPRSASTYMYVHVTTCCIQDIVVFIRGIHCVGEDEGQLLSSLLICTIKVLNFDKCTYLRFVSFIKRVISVGV